MTITQIVQSQQQQRIGGISQRTQGNPYGTPGMSLSDAGDYQKRYRHFGRLPAGCGYTDLISTSNNKCNRSDNTERLQINIFLR